MKIRILFLLVFSFPLILFAQNRDEQAIRHVLKEQVKNWNTGNIEQYMQGYWKSDSLMFIGKRGVVYGWKTTLENYKKSYPDQASMGKLDFILINLKSLSKEYYWVLGKWRLRRSTGNLQGNFTLLFHKLNGTWKIVADHSS